MTPEKFISELLAALGLTPDFKAEDVKSVEQGGGTTWIELHNGEVLYVTIQVAQPEPIEDYYPENSERVYTEKDFLEIAKGNRKYARSLRDRVTWQHPETLVEEDLMEEEIREVNGTYEIVADDYEAPDPETKVFRAMEGGTDGG